MSDLTARRAGIDVVLTNASIEIPPDQDLIGDRIFKPITVPLSTARVPAFGTEAFRLREDRVADHSEPDKLDIQVDTVLLEVEPHALMAPVSDREQRESELGPLKIDLAARALSTIVAQMRLAREKLQADLATNVNSYDNTHKIDLNGTSARWDTAIDPLANLQLLIDSTIPNDSGRRPNILAMGQPAWFGLIQNTAFLNRLYGSANAQKIPTTEEVARLLGLDAVLVGRAVSRTVAGAVTQVWGKNAVLVYSPTNGETPFGWTVEQALFNGATEAIVRFRDEKMGATGGDWIKRATAYSPVVAFKQAGALLYNVVT